MPRFPTIVTKLLLCSLALLRAILKAMPAMPAQQANLILFPLGFLRAELGDVVRGLTDEAALSRSHPRDPQWMLGPAALLLVVVGFGF